MIDKLALVIDRALYFLFFRRKYRSEFANYGNNVRWGRDFRRFIIPSSVRISCREKIRIGNDCQIDEDVYLQCHYAGDGISLGSGCRINAGAHILSYSKIEIGSHVLIAPRVMISSGNHGFHSLSVPIMHQPHEKSGEIAIGDGCWIAQDAKVLGSTSIGRNCVIGAGSVVKGNFEIGSVIVGVPGKCIQKIV